MDEIGLFPLGIVLLPGERVPLHIFEPRYRELIAECLREQSTFGLMYAGEGGLSPIGTRAFVVEVLQRYEDGRMDVVVEGRARFRLEETTAGRSFLTGNAEEIPDEDDQPTDDEVAACLARFRQVLRTAGDEAQEIELGDGSLSYAISARIDFGPDVKQELLEEVSERTRIGRLTELLGNASALLDRNETIHRRAQSNGRVDHM